MTITNTSTVTANTTLYAHWRSNVVLRTNGGFIPGYEPSQTINTAVSSGNTIGTLNLFNRHPVRDNYRFVGWFSAQTGGTQITANTVVNGHINVWARWELLFQDMGVYTIADGTAANSRRLSVANGYDTSSARLEVTAGQTSQNEQIAQHMRLYFHQNLDAWTIAPISSSNGLARRVAVMSNNTLQQQNLPANRTPTAAQQFTIEPSGAGFIIRMRSDPNRVLTRGSGTTVTVAAFSAGNANQIWRINPNTAYMNQESYYANIGREWVWPVNNAVITDTTRRFRTTSGFGFRNISGRKFHSGHDVGNGGQVTGSGDDARGPQLIAVTSGQLGRQVWRDARGWCVDLTIADRGTFNNRNAPLVVRYQHLHPSLDFFENRDVARGAVVGRMGTTGVSTGVHLHWEVFAAGDVLGDGTTTANSTMTNPLQFFRHFHDRITTD
jgi:uncharacterized repeat protein (TIGR02543 family)